MLLFCTNRINALIPISASHPPNSKTRTGNKEPAKKGRKVASTQTRRASSDTQSAEAAAVKARAKAKKKSADRKAGKAATSGIAATTSTTVDSNQKLLTKIAYLTKKVIYVGTVLSNLATSDGRECKGAELKKFVQNITESITTAIKKTIAKSTVVDLLGFVDHVSSTPVADAGSEHTGPLQNQSSLCKEEEEEMDDINDDDIPEITTMVNKLGDEILKLVQEAENLKGVLAEVSTAVEHAVIGMQDNITSLVTNGSIEYQRIHSSDNNASTPSAAAAAAAAAGTLENDFMGMHATLPQDTLKEEGGTEGNKEEY